MYIALPNQLLINALGSWPVNMIAAWAWTHGIPNSSQSLHAQTLFSKFTAYDSTLSLTSNALCPLGCTYQNLHTKWTNKLEQLQNIYKIMTPYFKC